ncbi:peptidase S8 [Polaribacter sp. SA4-10]|uniref:S8 family serine peptidase n=1 Tax=Polaribacter sp. SA4-10 TaxID=754397 RepID=UPI000B3D2E57|nr:S8 family serine peptidase [Polaribacter sp. SA4-10]ARV05733.1 peptidase S8 [Polaribacter sp. SA4-10]
MKKLLLLFTFLISSQFFAQEDAWVYLKDKPSFEAYLATPLNMLSQRALDRRSRQNIAVDVIDVPVDDTYYSQVKSASGITVLAKSKWLNAIHVFGQEVDINNLISNFSFIESIEFADDGLNANGKTTKRSSKTKHKNKFAEMKADYNYGVAETQITMLKGDFLHQEGFTGSGMHIAVIDAGFPNVNQLQAFQKIRDNNQILGGYDFVNRNENFYAGSNHGTNVLSDIAGYIDGVFVGTAPDASFYLFITEDTANEVPLEESLWVEAAERADSLGVDVINTSLGYTTFDDPNYNYSYEDMDGKTAFISRGADIIASRGMILVTSAGNSGSDSWKYIGAPGDAASVFTVGAVDAVEDIASFSSFGPTSDGRVKPDVLAHGENVFVIDHQTGTPKPSNGTSFSSPVMTGVVACFWQATPQLTSTQVMQKIRESADRYTNPDEQYGYGIPDFKTAYEAVLNVDKQNFINTTTIYPNPVSTSFTLKMKRNDLNGVNVKIYNLLGKKVYEEGNLKSNVLNVSVLNSGIYILKITSGKSQKTIKLVKN